MRDGAAVNPRARGRHVVGGVLAGQHVREVRLGELDGDVDLYGRLVATLMGPMAEGQPPPSWPPLPDLHGCNDEHIAATLVMHLKLSRADHMAAVALAAHQLNDPLVKWAIAQVARALGQHSVLTGQEIEELLRPNMVAWLEPERTPYAAASGQGGSLRGHGSR